jgi:hypothetical protein
LKVPAALLDAGFFDEDLRLFPGGMGEGSQYQVGSRSLEEFGIPLGMGGESHPARKPVVPQGIQGGQVHIQLRDGADHPLGLVQGKGGRKFRVLRIPVPGRKPLFQPAYHRLALEIHAEDIQFPQKGEG